jgi:hypothetical protein
LMPFGALFLLFLATYALASRGIPQASAQSILPTSSHLPPTQSHKNGIN